MMVLDTTLLVRLATNDVPSVRTSVIELLKNHEARISKAVPLETEWVPRSRYGYKVSQFVELVEYLLALPSLAIEDEDVVRWPLMRLVPVWIWRMLCICRSRRPPTKPSIR